MRSVQSLGVERTMIAIIMTAGNYIIMPCAENSKIVLQHISGSNTLPTLNFIPNNNASRIITPLHALCMHAEVFDTPLGNLLHLTICQDAMNSELQSELAMPQYNLTYMSKY